MNQSLSYCPLCFRYRSVSDDYHVFKRTLDGVVVITFDDGSVWAVSMNTLHFAADHKRSMPMEFTDMVMRHTVASTTHASFDKVPASIPANRHIGFPQTIAAVPEGIDLSQYRYLWKLEEIFHRACPWLPKGSFRKDEYPYPKRFPIGDIGFLEPL